MFNRLKSVVSGAVEGLEGPRNHPAIEEPHVLKHKHKYCRPAFLHITDESINVALDKRMRAILSSSTSNCLPYEAGYAECVNAGKSNMNEDMAQVYTANIRSTVNNVEYNTPYAYYGLFDGHAGHGAALDASKQMHHIIHQKLVDSMDAMLASIVNPDAIQVDKKALITGALETSFVEMDEVIKESKNRHSYPGGCTAIVALFIFDELYVANAGDCRAGICDNFVFIPMTNDFSPTYDQSRIYTKAWENPRLLGEKYTTRTFLTPPTRDDLGKLVLYKDPYMTGWSLKTVETVDLRCPLITGVGRKSRIMGTIGVARGLGDFDLIANHNKTPIKPFLSCIPEVKVISSKEIGSSKAVLVLASDGLWDAVSTATVVQRCSNLDFSKDKCAYITAAMTLVDMARGRRDPKTDLWMLESGTMASLDDISVFVIPLASFFEKNAHSSLYKLSNIPTDNGSITPPVSPMPAELKVEEQS